MPSITVIDSQDREVEVSFTPGDTLLQASLAAGAEGLLAECGGGCSCATCHVMLTADWQDTLEPPAAQEQDMLTFAVEPTPNSRLACQVVLQDAHDGLTATVAKRQF